MKNSIKLIAAGAIAIAAFATTSAQAQDIVIGGAGSKSFVGTLKVTPGKYITLATPGVSVSSTFNPVTMAGTLIEQGSVSSSTSAKVNNASILKEIYGLGPNDRLPKGTSLVWQVEGSDVFAQGKLVALQVTKTSAGTTYAITDAESIFSTEFLTGELVTTSKTAKTDKKKNITTTTTNFSAGIYGVQYDGIRIEGVGTLKEVDVSGGNPNISITATIPLSGTYIPPVE
jgi:hypothetical protein